MRKKVNVKGYNIYIIPMMITKKVNVKG